MLTDLGKWLRTLRLSEDELLKDMAHKIGVTPSYLSVIENGRRNMSDALVRKISEKYKLTEAKQTELKSLAVKDRMKIEVDLTGMSKKRQLAARDFYNNLNNLDEDKIAKIIKLLK